MCRGRLGLLSHFRKFQRKPIDPQQRLIIHNKLFSSITTPAMKSRVFVTRCRESFPDDAMQRLEAACEVTYWKDDSVIPHQDLVENVHDKEGVLCLLTDKVDSPVIEAAKSLKVIATMSVGFDHLDVESLRSRDVSVGYTPGVLTDATAELTVSLVLATSRRLMEGSTALRAGAWTAWSPLWLCGPQLSGSTVGIVGLGNIGQAVMARLKPFGVSKFVYCGRTKKDSKLEDGAEFVGFEDLLKVSDFVIVTCSYTPDLSKKFNKEAFKLMKKTSIFINTSRGGIVDQEALVEALGSKEIFAAGLDVMTPEPLPVDHALTRLDNCVLVPHLGSATIQTRAVMAHMTVDNILAGLNGELDKMPARLC